MNTYLAQAITTNGGTPTGVTTVQLLRELVTVYGGTPTKYTMIGLLQQAIEALGGTPSSAHISGLLSELAVALGGTATVDPLVALAQIATLAGGSGLTLKGVIETGRSGSGTSTIDFSTLSPAEGDMLLVITANTQSGATMVSSGYTQAFSHGYTNSNSGLYAETKAFWKTLGAAETSVQISGGPSNFFLFLLSGAHATTPIEAVSAPASGNNTDRANPAPVTPLTDGSLVFGFGGGGYNISGALTNPSNFYTDFYHREQTGPSFYNNAAVGVLPWATGDGTIDPPAFTGGANQFNGAWAAGSIVVKPA